MLFRSVICGNLSSFNDTVIVSKPFGNYVVQEKFDIDNSTLDGTHQSERVQELSKEFSRFLKLTGLRDVYLGIKSNLFHGKDGNLKVGIFDFDILK